jgi:hypothetical protein
VESGILRDQVLESGFHEKDPVGIQMLILLVRGGSGDQPGLIDGGEFLVAKVL